MTPALLLRILSGSEAGRLSYGQRRRVRLRPISTRSRANLRYDAEEDLSRWSEISPRTGLPKRAAASSRGQMRCSQTSQRTARNFQRSSSRARARMRVREFIAQVDELRDAVARMEKRIENLNTRARIQLLLHIKWKGASIPFFFVGELIWMRATGHDVVYPGYVDARAALIRILSVALRFGLDEFAFSHSRVRWAQRVIDRAFLRSLTIPRACACSRARRTWADLR